MRVTGNRMIDMAATTTAANQSKVAAAAAEVSSGMRVTKPSDDPEAWALAQRAEAKRTLSDGAGAALKSGRERLDLVDDALSNVGESVASLRELVVQGANASYGASDRAQLAVKARALLQGAVAAANTQTADGEYVLAGTVSLTAPFSAGGAYGGDATARALPITDDATTTGAIAGSELTAASGVDVLPLFERVAVALEANDVTTLQSLLDDIGQATSQVGLARTRTGGTMNVLDDALNAHAALGERLASQISNAVETDVIASASNLAKASTALEASRAVTSHIVALVDPTK